MPERLHRLASSIDAPAPPTADHGLPGKQTRAGDLPGAAAATQTAVSRVKAYAGEVVEDGSGFEYRVIGDSGAFEVAVAPRGSEHAIGRLITPEGKLARSWMMLARILFARPPVRARSPAPAELARDDAPAPPATNVADWFPSLGPVVDAIDAAVRPLAAFACLMVEDDGLQHELDMRRRAPVDPTAPDANLVAAKQITDTTTVPHPDYYKKQNGEAVPGDVEGRARRKAIVDGDVAKLESMRCSELTSLTLQKTGVDLDALYVDPVKKMPVGYIDAAGKLAFADLYSVTINQADALEAVLAAQHGKGKVIEDGMDEARTLQTKSRTPRQPLDLPFYFVELTGTLSFAKGDVFGAGATATQLGGKEIETLADRRPGDLQQWMKTEKGTSNGEGHSSQVWAVRGTGVAYLGGVGSPELDPKVTAPIPPGWYAVEGVKWLVKPETNPAMVASLHVDTMELIEANDSLTDATRVGAPRDAMNDYDPEANRSTITSAGRLPSSKWFAWEKSTPALAGTITATGVKPAAP